MIQNRKPQHQQRTNLTSACTKKHHFIGTFQMLLTAITVLFTLAVQGAWAQTWSATEAPAAGATLVDNDDITVTTVFAANLGGAAKEYADYNFSNSLQVRVAAWPTVSVPDGTEASENNATPLVITAKKAGTLTVYYRRQANSGSYDAGDNKDVFLYERSTATKVSGALTFYVEDSENYGYCKEVYSLEAGKAYTLCASGTTIQLNGFNYVVSGSTPELEPIAFEDFKINFRTDPYTVILPVGGELPECVTVNGTFYDVQHGYNSSTITVKVDGPTKFTFGTCSYGTTTATVKGEDKSELASVNCGGSCDGSASYNNFVTWTYNSETQQTLTIKTPSYLPFLYAEKCELIRDVTVKYYAVDGTELASETEEGNSALTYKYGASNLTVPTGKAFRGWADATGQKIPEGTVLTQDLSLYPVVTDVETAAVGKTFEYDLTKATFYQEDHELLEMTGSYYNNHGWKFNNGQTIKLQVAGDAIVNLGLCSFSSAGDITVTDGNGATVGTIAAKVGADGATASINYSGAATTLTFTMPGGTYIHNIKVYNVEAIPEKVDGQYTVIANSASDLLLKLAIAKAGDVIYVPNGTYDLGTATLTPVPAGVTLRGESMEGVLIQNSPVKEVINNTATLLVAGDNITIEDLTLKCRAPYGTGDDTKTAERGLCIQDKGDNNVFRRVKLDGYQDTYWSQKAKVGNTSYFYDCVLMGNVDFICGSGNVWFENCKLQIVPCHSDAQGTVSTGTPYIVAPSTADGETGYIFNNCTIENATSTNMDGKFYLGRGWQNNPKASFFNTTMKIKPIPVAFLYKMSASDPDLPCVWQELGSVYANGTAVDVSERPANTVIDVKDTPEAKPLPAVKVEVVGTRLTWATVSGAVAYNVYKDNAFYARVNAQTAAKGLMSAGGSDMSYIIPDDQTTAEWSVRAINSYGVVGLTIDEDDPLKVEFSDEAKVIDTTNKPFGFVTATDRTSTTSIDLSKITGGGALTIEEAMAKAAANDASVITLQSDGVTPMDEEIKNAITNKNIIIFDGGGTSKDFIVSAVMKLGNLSGKTIIGINGARLCTEFFLTERYKNLLDNVPTASGTGVTSASTASGTGGKFTYANGKVIEVGEEEEFLSRKVLYEALEKDYQKNHPGEQLNKEPYKDAGIFYFYNCQNFVIRNLKLIGPGSVDVGGTDLMSIIDGSKHFWVDHCEFTDGIDGNFDITNGSDFVTVSWCKFSYTDRAYAHENTNLVGSDDNKTAMDTGKLNITFAYNEWGKGCDGRMPMARFGKIHMLNNYYTCDGNTQNAMNPRKNSEFLIEGNLWTKGVTKTYKEDGALAVTWGASNVVKSASGTTGSNKGTQPVTVPYQYDGLMLDVNKLPEVLALNGGAVLGSSPVFTTNLDFTNDAYEATPTEAAKGLTFSVWAENAHTFQWYKKQNGETEWTKIPDASRNSYTYISNKVEMLQLMCRAYGVSGTADSKTLTLTIKDGDPAFTTNLNANYILYGDKDLTLEVDASNLCTYQWYKCDDASKTNAQAIDGATKRSYTVAKATAAGNSYYYCVATYTPATGDRVVLTSTVATLKAELNDGRKLWVYGYKDYTTSATGDTRIKQVVGTVNAVASDCADKKCSVDLNAANGVSGYTFTPCSTHYNNPAAYAELTTTSALVSTDKIKIGINQSQASSPNNEYGFYLCTAKTKTDASLVATIAIPTTAGKNLYEATINVADYFEKLAGKTKFYLLPFNPSTKKVNLHEVLVLSYPAEDPAITTDIENAEYETPKGESIELSVEASYVKGYQWYTCTASDKSGEAVIDGATSANYTFSSKTDGTFYVFCRAIGLKADTYADSRVAKIVVTKGKKMAVFSYLAKDNGSGKYAEELTGGSYDLVVTSDDNCSITKASANDKSSNKIFGLLSANKTTSGHRNIHGYIRIALDTPLLGGDVFKFGTNTSSTDKPNSTYGFYLNNSDNNQTTGTKIANPANPSTATTENSGKNLWETTIDVPNELIGESVIYLHPFVGKDGANINLHELTITRFQLPEAPAFTTDLDTEYNDAIVGIKKTLTVAATGAESYQWYKNRSNTTEGATAIADATATSYDFTATEAGDTYIYCVATNEIGSTPSTIAKVHAANAATIIKNLEAEYTTTRGTNVPLTVEVQNATSYQWYSNTKNSEDGATEIEGATEATYTFPANNLLTRYIYCVAKDASEGTAKTKIAKVTVNPAAGEENTETLTVQSWATPLEGEAVENAEAGTVDVNGKKYVAGDEIKMTATPAHGYKFDHWADNTGAEISSATVTVPTGGVTYRAYFTKLPEYALTIVNRLGGATVDNTNVSVTADDTHETHATGEKIKLTANTKTGYSFVKWTSDEAGETVLSTDNPYTYTTTEVATTIYAQFDSQYIVEFSKGSVECVGSVPKNAYFDASGSQFTLPKNTSLYKEGHTLTGWKLQGPDPEIVKKPGETYTVNNKSGNVFEPVFTPNTVEWSNRPSAVVATWTARDFNAAKITWQNNTGVYVTQVVYDEKTVDIPLFIDATTGKFGPNSNEWIQVNEGTKITFKSDATNLPALKKATISLTAKNAPQTATLNGVIQTSAAMSYKPKTEADVVFVADAKVGYLGDIKLTLPPLVAGDEIAIYKSSFNDWQGQISDNKNTVTTKDQKQKVTFTLNAVTASDNGTNTKFTSADGTASPGYLMAAKSAADITTTTFHSISKIVFYHAATGSNRGFGLKVKGVKDGVPDADWLPISTTKTNGYSRVEVPVNRTDVQLQFYNLEPSQNAYMTDLAIYAFVTLAQCEDPEVVKGEWDPAAEKWNYTVTASLPEDATVHYCKVNDGVDGDEQTGTDEVAIKIAPGEKYKFWTVDSYGELPISNKVEITGDAMQKTVAPMLTVEPYSISGKTHTVKVSGLAAGATAHYTVKDAEGNVVSEPAVKDYTGEFTIEPGQTVEVYASQTHYANSDVVSKTTTTITLPQKETFKTTGPGKADAETKGLDNVLNPAYIEGKYISGINGETGLKYTINNAVKTIDGKEVKGIEIKVHEGYVINRVDVENAYSNQDKQTDVTAIYVDGKKLDGFTSKNLPQASTKKTAEFSIEGIEAKESIIIQIVSDDTQARANISVTYDFIDEPVSVAIKQTAGTAAVATINYSDFTDNAYTYTTTLDYIPVVEMTTKQGYVYTMPDKEVDGFNHTFKYTVMGKEYSVKTTVSVLSSPGITVDESHVSVAGGYPVTLSGAGTMYINIDEKTDENGDLVWEEYDPAKKYYAVKYVKSYCEYNGNYTISEPSEYTVSKDVYDYTKPFAVFVRQPSYLDSQDGSNPYNTLAPEAADKIYQALQTNFNVVDFVKPSSTEVLKEMPDIADAKLVVITEMISGSGSYSIQRPQDKETQDSKSTALTMTLLRDVVDKTNVINFKMFTYSQSKNNTDRWGWAQPAALPSGVISINPVEPNGGGMYELFSEARMSLDGSITLWDNINEDKNLNHLQPVFNFAEGEHVPSFQPLAMAVDPDNQEEQYHILHYYDKVNEETHKKTTYVGFGLSVNEWTAYNDNVKAIVEKIGEMIIAGRPLNTKLDHIVDPKITDNGDGSATVMNNNFSAKTYYLASDTELAEDVIQTDEYKNTIKNTGYQTLAENNFFTVKYTTDKKLYAVSELGGAFSNVVVADLKGSTTRYITRVTDDPAATGLEARYPFEVNPDGTAKAFDFPYNQSWKKDGYTVTKWIDVNNGTEYTPGVSVNTLNTDITVKAVWTENTHKITDLSKDEDKAQRTVTWEFRQSKGAPALAMESKAGNMQAVLVGQVHFNVYDEEGHKTGEEFIDVPMTINTDNTATLPDNGTSYHGKFNNSSTNWVETVAGYSGEGSDYAQVRTGTQFTFPTVYGSNVVYKAVDLLEKDATTHEANGNVNRAQISQSYITDGTEDGEGNTNYWRLSNPGFQLTPGWSGEVLQPNSTIVFNGDAAQLATTSPTYDKYKEQMGQLGYDNKLYDDGGGNFNYGGLIYYDGDATMATLTSVESAQYVHVGSSKKLGSLNYGSVFMQSLSVTYPVLYDLTCTWIAVGNEENPHKSELDPTENPGKIEKLTEARPNCGGRFVKYDDILLKLTPSYGYYVDVDKDDDPETTTVNEAYYFLKNGEDATSAFQPMGTDSHVYRYMDTGYEDYSDDIKANIPVDGAYIVMKVEDIDLVVSLKKYQTRTYSITAYPGDMGVININTGNGRDPEDEYDQFPEGKTIVVTAAPKMGYKFKEWRLNPDEKDPTNTGTVVAAGTDITGITFGDGRAANPLVDKKFLEKNELAVVVNEDNASNDKHYYAIFEEGVEGTANYQFANALEQYVDGEGHIQTKALELGADAINAFPTSYKSTALNIPRYYTLYKEGYTLDHWVENTTPNAAQPTLGKTYDIGTFYYFDTKDENRYLIPVFTENPISYDHRAVPVDITWDFRSAKFAQRMSFVRTGQTPYPADKMIYYSTHATINNKHLMDVPLKVTLGTKGKLKNDTDDEWCAIGEGTEIVIPSGIGAKFTVASLSRMTSTKFIEKDALGNEVNSVVPTTYERKSENGVDVYYYSYITQSTSTDITLKIGDDYSYYKSIRAELPAADAVPLKVTVNNSAFGGVEMTHAIHTDGTDHLDAIKKTYAAIPESEGNGGVYTLGLGTTVTLHATRNHLYIVDYFEDIFGTKYYFDNAKSGNIRAVAADGTDVSATAYSSGMSMAKVTDVLGTNNDVALTFMVNAYENLIHVIYKENKLYQINYTSGEEAEGEAPGIKLIEEGESFTVPKENHYLYVDGQTLKYWVDAAGNKYDFGQSYTPGQRFTATKDLPSGIKSGEGFKVPLDNLFLTPHFDVNDFTVMNLTEDATAVWPLTREGKSGSDDPKGNYAGNDDVVIYFQKSVGIYVTPLKLADGRFIDLKLDMKCAKVGKIDNQNNGERCQINGESVIGVPSSSNCEISLYTVNGKLSTTVIAGATGSADGMEGDKVVATKYTSTTVSGSNDVATVAYTGSNTMVDIEFMGEAGYFYQIEAKYKKVETTLPELDYVTIDNIALGALGTGLSNFKLADLRDNGEFKDNEGQTRKIAADLRNSTSGNMPVVKAQASNNGVVEITQATIDKPVATILVKTRDGVTVSVHKIFFDVTPPENAPIINDVKIGTRYQCDIELIDADATTINNTWEHVYPEGSYIYGYKIKNSEETGTTDKYIKTVEDAGINGSIAIRFNKTMKATDVKIEALNNQIISAEEGQTLVFSYWGLDLNTTYDFVIPANTFEDIYGNKYAHPVRISFKTVEHAVKEENRLINFVVTHNQPVKWNQETFSMVPDGQAKQIASDELIRNLDAAGIDHGTLDEGVKKANAAKDNSERYYIFVPDGEYQLQGNTSIQAAFASSTYAPADNTGKLRDELLYKSNGNKPVWNGITEIARDNISITGQSKDKTVVWNRPEIEGISYTATFRLNNATSNFYAQDMTWENRFDFKTSIAKQGAASAQAARAVVLQDRSAKSVFKNINMMSYQDTYYSNPTGSKEETRYYFENCTIGGYVDFLCGSGDVWLEKCNLIVRGGKGTNASNIMAPAQYPTDEWGYVFNHCNIYAEDDAYNINNGKFTLARPWKESPAATLLYTTYYVLPTADAYKAMSNTGQLLRIHEFRSYHPDGTLVDLSQRSLRNSSPGAGSYDAVMTPSEAERYTVFNAMGGNDGYDPTILTRQVSMKNNKLGQDDTSLAWDKEPEALCYFIFRKDNESDTDWKLFAVTADTEFELDDKQLDKWFCVRAANQRGGLGEATEAYQYKAHESYERALVQNGQVIEGWRWSTIYLDFNAKAPIVQHEEIVNGKQTVVDDIFVYAVTKVSATSVSLKRVKVLEAGRGYVIKARPRPEVYVFKYTQKNPIYYQDDMTLAQYVAKKKTVEPEFDLNVHSLLNGSVVNISAPANSGYTLSSKASGLGFYKYTGSEYNAYLAWLDAALVAKAQKEEADNLNNGISTNAKNGYVQFIFEDDLEDSATDLDAVSGSENEGSNDAIYNLAGQRINPSQLHRGQIYIIGGKKIRY